MLFSFFTPWRKRPSRAVTSRPRTARLGLETLEGRAAPSALTTFSGVLTRHGADSQGPAHVGSPQTDHPGSILHAATHGRHVQRFVFAGDGQINVLPDGSLNPVLTVEGTIIGHSTGTASLTIADNGLDFSGSGYYTTQNGDRLNFIYTGRFAHPAGTVEQNSFSGSAVFLGGTGQFSDAIGYVTFQGVLNSDNTFHITHSGLLAS